MRPPGISAQSCKSDLEKIEEQNKEYNKEKAVV